MGKSALPHPLTPLWKIVRDAEPGDVYRLRFHAEAPVREVAIALRYLMFLGQLISDDGRGITYMMALIRTREWGGVGNRTFTFRIGDDFDSVQFQYEMRGYIEQLSLMKRARPLVDAALLERAPIIVRFRFKDGQLAICAARQLLTLCQDERLMLYSSSGMLGFACDLGYFSQQTDREGHLIVRDNLAEDVLRQVIDRVIPQLELLRD